MKIPKNIKSKWDEELSKSGFEDIERRGGYVKDQDRRTIAFENRDRILHFFLVLDQLMGAYEKMPNLERRVMQMYSEGQKIKEIVRKLRFSDGYVRKVIRRYKGLVLAIDRMQGRDAFPESLEPQELRGSEGENGKNRFQD